MAVALAAYGGWNTASNTLGGVIATLVATVVARRSGLDTAEPRQAELLRRLLEDGYYQSVIRPELAPAMNVALTREDTDPEAIPAYRAAVARRLVRALARLDPVGEWRLEDVRLPWARAFEVDFTLRRG